MQRESEASITSSILERLKGRKEAEFLETR